LATRSQRYRAATRPRMFERETRYPRSPQALPCLPCLSWPSPALRGIRRPRGGLRRDVVGRREFPATANCILARQPAHLSQVPLRFCPRVLAGPLRPYRAPCDRGAEACSRRLPDRSRNRRYLTYQYHPPRLAGSSRGRRQARLPVDERVTARAGLRFTSGSCGGAAACGPALSCRGRERVCRALPGTSARPTDVSSKTRSRSNKRRRNNHFRVCARG
jgi:hypothetical protein